MQIYAFVHIYYTFSMYSLLNKSSTFLIVFEHHTLSKNMKVQINLDLSKYKISLTMTTIMVMNRI